jgi:hypothetical protein
MNDGRQEFPWGGLRALRNTGQVPLPPDVLSLSFSFFAALGFELRALFCDFFF